MPRSNSSSRSSSPRSSSPRSVSKPVIKSSPRPSSPSSTPLSPTPSSPSIIHHEHKTSMGIMDGVKWGFGTSIGHSIGNLFGFGTQNVHVENQTRPISPAPTAIKTDFDKCMETSTHEKKLSYCYEYDKCLKTSPSINCAEVAEKATLKYDE